MNLLYDDFDTDIGMLLCDIGINVSHKGIRKIIAKDDDYIDIIMQIGVKKVLSIFDMFMMSDIVDMIINMNIRVTMRSPILIINHTLSNNDIISACTNGYHVLHNGRICATDQNISNCESLYELTITDTNKHITTLAPFAKTLKKFTMNYDDKFTDDDLCICTSIEEFNIDNHNNPYDNNNATITTCKPFAKTLRKLSINACIGIHDSGLHECSAITELNADYNVHITMCDPFAQTLRKLSAKKWCGIDDHGLRLCKSIEKLDAQSNPKITTCNPFAESLRILIANNDMYCTQKCGINDMGLCLCVSLTELNASNNQTITTCAPFAKSLRILNADYQCGITDDGLRLCDSIEELYADFNNKITTCDPFLRSLGVLSAAGTCGISDKEIRRCKSLYKLDAYNNNKISIYVKYFYDIAENVFSYFQ